MLKGRFGNTSDAPYLEARVAFPRLGAQGHISFLVDTGADGTIFMPTDCRKLGIDFKALRNPNSSDGIGGRAKEFRELALLSFADSKFVYHYLLKDAAISEPTPHNQRFPSLLGRDILHNWRFAMCKLRSEVTFTPLKWNLRQAV